MVRLQDLLGVLPPDAALHPPGAGLVTVRDVTHDSREVGQYEDVLFACRPGGRADGHDFAEGAINDGAVGLLVERRLDVSVPQLVVGRVAQVLGPVAAKVHDEPSTRLALCGITGTNGKTTTAFLLESALRAAGHITGLIGTVLTRIGATAVPGVRTTPEATDLQRLLRRMVDAGVTATAMEVSSHGLALGRVRGTRFSVSAFTNLTQDHLDFHRDLEDYFRAKATLFDPAMTDTAVVNIDDPYGRRLLEGLRIPAITVSLEDPGADVSALDVVVGRGGSEFKATVAGRAVAVRTALPGRFNVLNCLSALAMADAVGVSSEAAAAGIAEVAGVPGRMERIESDQPFTVLVDYAHTPDSLQNVLTAARELAGSARVLVVVGCGGDRDRGKRPAMGRAAVSLADLAVLTSDNPRSEDPLAILEDVAGGAAQVAGGRWMVEPDRASAIAEALQAAAPGDVVVIAGKGHETYQELADRVIDFDDREIARRVLAGDPVRRATP